ncbi:MAG: type II toxin-antitoxin system VapC family toxin [Lautropia sp.]|nr:type II toxin-antitoxin system VapC family toxin [Lautropia sp.]
MRVLVDSSVWIAHFRFSNAVLSDLLNLDSVLMHPMVLAELACGTPPKPRESILKYLGNLQPAEQVSLTELMAFIERHKLFGLGCGVIDLLLLASALITPDTRLWTLDKRLANLATRFNIGFQSPG